MTKLHVEKLAEALVTPEGDRIDINLVRYPSGVVRPKRFSKSTAPRNLSSPKGYGKPWKRSSLSGWRWRRNKRSRKKRASALS
jgi:hypothetical protein